MQGASVIESLRRESAEKDAEFLRLRAQIERLASEHRSMEAQLRAEYEQSIAALTRRCDKRLVALRRNLDAQGDGLCQIDPPSG
jgi:septal ring factor EnvC (AmiA/AmiB activator)